jgi:hypothetical protein
MTTRAKYVSGVQTFFEDKTYETVMPMAPLTFADDFIGAGHSAGVPAAGAPVAGYPWVKKIVASAGTPTAALISNAAGGQMQLALAATSELEEATLYWNDNLAIDVTKGAVWECRAALTVPPSVAGAQVVLGLAAAWSNGPDTNAKYLEFGCTANANLLARSQDGTTQNSIAAAVAGSPVALDTGFHMFRIDCNDVTDVGFYFDGNRCNAKGSIGFASTGANAILQPYLSVYKTASASLGTLVLDKVDIWANR